jgi:hypothetical protein
MYASVMRHRDCMYIIKPERTSSLQLNFQNASLIKCRHCQFPSVARENILDMSDSYPAFFLPIATTSNKNF